MQRQQRDIANRGRIGNEVGSGVLSSISVESGSVSEGHPSPGPRTGPLPRVVVAALPPAGGLPTAPGSGWLAKVRCPESFCSCSRNCPRTCYRWGYTIRKCWQTLWGALQQVRVPRLRGRQEVGLLEKYQRHSLEEVLFALAVAGLSQRKVVGWVRRSNPCCTTSRSATLPSIMGVSPFCPLGRK